MGERVGAQGEYSHSAMIRPNDPLLAFLDLVRSRSGSERLEEVCKLESAFWLQVPEQGLPASHLCTEGRPCVGPPRLTKRVASQLSFLNTERTEFLLQLNSREVKHSGGLLRKSQCI